MSNRTGGQVDEPTREWAMVSGFKPHSPGTYTRPLGGGFTLAMLEIEPEGNTLSVVAPGSNDVHADKLILSEEPTKEDVLAIIVMGMREWVRAGDSDD